jgi:hypothetical protein
MRWSTKLEIEKFEMTKFVIFSNHTRLDQIRVKMLFSNYLLESLVSELDSQSKGCGFESRFIQILDGLKAMPGSIPAPNSG